MKIFKTASYKRMKSYSNSSSYSIYYTTIDLPNTYGEIEEIDVQVLYRVEYPYAGTLEFPGYHGGVIIEKIINEQTGEEVDSLINKEEENRLIEDIEEYISEEDEAERDYAAEQKMKNKWEEEGV